VAEPEQVYPRKRALRPGIPAAPQVGMTCLPSPDAVGGAAFDLPGYRQQPGAAVPGSALRPPSIASPSPRFRAAKRRQDRHRKTRPIGSQSGSKWEAESTAKRTGIRSLIGGRIGAASVIVRSRSDDDRTTIAQGKARRFHPGSNRRWSSRKLLHSYVNESREQVTTMPDSRSYLSAPENGGKRTPMAPMARRTPMNGARAAFLQSTLA